MKRLYASIFIVAIAAIFAMLFAGKAHAHENNVPPPPVVPSADRCSPDKWVAFDKGLHFGGGAIISGFVTAKTQDPWQGFAWGAGAGLLKEGIDKYSGGCVSAKDFAVTVLGAAVGASFVNWNIKRQNGTTMVTYSVKFN